MDLTFNMTLERIIDIAQRQLCNSGIQCNLVLHKLTEPCQFKAYVKHTYTVWSIVGEQKIKLLTVQHISREVNDIEKQIALEAVEDQALYEFIHIIRQPNIEDILYGRAYLD